jgi:hypothetical protein
MDQETMELHNALARVAVLEMTAQLQIYIDIGEVPFDMIILDREILEKKISRIVKEHLVERRGNRI